MKFSFGSQKLSGDWQKTARTEPGQNLGRTQSSRVKALVKCCSSYGLKFALSKTGNKEMGFLHICSPHLTLWYTPKKTRKYQQSHSVFYVLHLRESNFISIQDPRFSIGRYKRYTPDAWSFVWWMPYPAFEQLGQKGNFFDRDGGLTLDTPCRFSWTLP